MQISEFIEATGILEQYYGKELTNEQRQITYEQLKDLTIERYRKVISKCLRTCKYMPKIADMIAANAELIGEITQEEEKKEVCPCKKCDGSGYVLYTKFIANGDIRLPYTYVARCLCKNGELYANKKIPTYEELGINVSNRINQVKDTMRKIEDVKKELINNLGY